jgi:ribosomal protein L11 methyltransferase
MGEGGLVEVVLRVPAAEEEQAVAHLLEYSPSGFRQESQGDEVEFGVYVPAPNAHLVATYLQRAGVTVSASATELVPADYAERWREFHQPVTIGELWVGPPWQEQDAPAGLKKVVIEPGQGFGTGAHPTTRLVLTLLLEQRRCSVLDVGCGSGVLAVAAGLLGFAPVTAIDNDPVAIDATTDNVARHGMSSIQVRLVDATTERLPYADLVLANLTLEPLEMLAPRLKVPRIIASGLLRSQVETATAAFEAAGYVVRERRDRDGWAALVLDAVDPEQAVMRHARVD